MVIMMLTDREMAIYALGKTEGIHCVAETFGKGFDDKKYVESWNKALSLLGVKMSLKNLEEIYDEFAKKMDKVTKMSNDHVVNPVDANTIGNDNVDVDADDDGSSSSSNNNNNTNSSNDATITSPTKQSGNNNDDITQ